MSQQLDRPARRPRPAADEGQDPVDYHPPAPTPAKPVTASVDGKDTPSVSAAAATPTVPRSQPPQLNAGGRELTVQLATRVSPEVAAMVDAEYARTGRSKRALIEEAIRNAPWHKAE